MPAARGILALSLCIGLLLPAGVAEAKAPKVSRGPYGDGSGEVQLVVAHNRARAKVSFEFHMLCYSPWGTYHGTSGPAPVTRRMKTIRRGGYFLIDGEYEGPAESGAQVIVFWGLSGRFTSPTRFKGVLSFEMGGEAGRHTLAPACIRYKRLTLNLEPPAG